MANTKQGPREYADFRATTAALHAVHEFYEFCGNADWQAVRRGAASHELTSLRRQIISIGQLLVRDKAIIGVEELRPIEKGA